jgi:hypothetical protein
MRKFALLFSLVLLSTISFAQIQDPVQWSYSAKKINATTYEIRLTAKMEPDWHIYSQTTPAGGPVPTEITFAKNPLLVLQGVAQEVGKLEKHHEPLFGVAVKQYSDKVEFVQIVKRKSPVKTSVKGTVRFMVCDNEQCLQPTTEKFSIELK